MLDTAEILKKVRQIEIKTRGLTNHIFAGEYHSAFKGRGRSFSEVREYNFGDDVRSIDWNVTARFNHPFVKIFEEERELTVMLLVDMSESSSFGTKKQDKRDLITELCAVLAFSAIKNNDKVGVIFFSDGMEKYIPPKKGKEHALYIVRELLTAVPKSTGTNISEALKFFQRSNYQKSIAFIMSDFIDEQYEDKLRVMSSRHDVIGLKIYDKMDMQLPNIGLLEVEDLETGNIQWLDTSDPLVRHNYQQNFIQQSEKCKQIFKRSGADLLHLRTDEDYVKILQQFFIVTLS